MTSPTTLYHYLTKYFFRKKTMFRRTQVLSLLLCGLATAANAQDAATQEKPAAEAKATEAQTTEEAPTALDFKVKSIDGVEVDLSKYKGNVVVIVNTASKCGMTPQYKQLQELHTKYGGQGVKVLGFPCNQFGGQEPGTEADIKTFCTKNYGVTFDMFSKVDVKGDEANDLFKFLTAAEVQPKGSGDVGWNFEKFVLDKTGKPIARFGSRVKPDSEEFVEVIKAAMAK